MSDDDRDGLNERRLERKRGQRRPHPDRRRRGRTSTSSGSTTPRKNFVVRRLRQGWVRVGKRRLSSCARDSFESFPTITSRMGSCWQKDIVAQTKAELRKGLFYDSGGEDSFTTAEERTTPTIGMPVGPPPWPWPNTAGITWKDRTKMEWTISSTTSLGTIGQDGMGDRTKMEWTISSNGGFHGRRR